MRASEWVILGLSTALLALAAALCGYQASAPQNFSFTENNVPSSVVLNYIASLLSAPIALMGLAAAAGLLFLRAARWTGSPADEQDPTPEPSP